MTRNFFALDDDWFLLFVDPRKLGTMQLVSDETPVVSNLGPEPLDESFTPDVFMERLERRKAPIKALLCEQSVIAGIGNIYADEILFDAAVHPLTPGGSLTPKQGGLMHKATVEILTQAIDKLADIVSKGGPPNGIGGRAGHAESAKEGESALRQVRRAYPTDNRQRPRRLLLPQVPGVNVEALYRFINVAYL